MAPYAPPNVGPAGLTVPAYQDVLNDMITAYKNIYGQSIYIGPDSADYQLLSVFALKISDIYQAFQLAFSNRSPSQAIGAALDTIVKINGLARKAAGYSSCVVTLTGAPGTVISGGIVQDVNGVRWDLPAQITIPVGGTINTSVICETIGAINAQAGQVNTIVTPTAGWTSVTNAGPAVPGQAVESDSSLRARQAISAALPSITMLAGTIAALAATNGVTRSQVYENPTGAVSDGVTVFGSPGGAPLPAGLPPHSITCVVEGGADAAVAQVIYNNRGVGCLTNGTTQIQVVDPSNGGLSMPINFYRPTDENIYVTLTVHQLPGYTSATTAAIQAAVASYINGLQIGETITLSGLMWAAMSATPNTLNPLFSIKTLAAGVGPNPPNTTVDIAVLFNQVGIGLAANVVINFV